MVLLTAALEGTDVVVDVDVPEGHSVAQLKESLAGPIGVPASAQQVTFRGRVLAEDAQTAKDAGLGDYDLVTVVTVGGPPGAAGRGAAAGGSTANPAMTMNADGTARDPVAFADAVMADTRTWEMLQGQNPGLAAAIRSRNSAQIQEVLGGIHRQREEHRRRQQEEYELANADPFDPEAQARIERMIAQQNIDAHLQEAMENTPEMFGSVVMLYVDVEVNGVKVKAFVDSGAQSTIMSKACADRLSLSQLMEERLSAVAQGVSTQKILGRVHSAPLKLGSAFLPTSLTILERQPMDLLLGLDMLRRHQMCIDLSKNMLVCASAGIEIPFLGEADIPKEQQLGRAEDGGDQDVEEATRASLKDAESTAAAPATPDADPEFLAKVTALTEMGIPREAAVEALAACNGDVESAGAMLLGG